jgi:hypothetical protein
MKINEGSLILSLSGPYSRKIFEPLKTLKKIVKSTFFYSKNIMETRGHNFASIIHFELVLNREKEMK